ncbi:MAG: peptidoglycan DD-metalloendopeptidase family protein [Anaerolineae bacterium]|nr:peptidoglycan DD-metalloendopeptidase family protein [Anaerolineae bacterium]
MKTRSFTFILMLAGSLLALCGILTVFKPSATSAGVVATPRTSNLYMPMMAKLYQTPPEPFLRAPYYGTWNMSCVFDHDLPGKAHDSKITHYNNVTSTREMTCYDGHNGYDYFSASRYDPVLAAANGKVIESQWQTPGNHRNGLGLYVRIDHENGYTSVYGHLSAATVDVGTQIANAADGHVIGISGNTGSVSGSNNCDPKSNPLCGGHLHFTTKHNGVIVDPYGWTKTLDDDPWVIDQDTDAKKVNAYSYNLWITNSHPSLVNAQNGNCTYPTGAARGRPTPPPADWAVIVDDGDANYSETPNCWTTANLAAAYGGDLRHVESVSDTAPTCYAQWTLPARAETAGEYQVFAHIVADEVLGQTTSQGAHYTIHHAGQDDVAILNQWAYTNTGHTSPWAYLGTYSFTRNGDESVSLHERTDDGDQKRRVLADAVRFLPLNPPPATNTPTPTPTATPTPRPATPTPTRTPTPTATPRPYLDTFEPNNSMDEAHNISQGSLYESYIWTKYDHDFYAILLNPNPSSTMNIYLQSIPEGADYDLRLYGPDRTGLGSSTNPRNEDEAIRYRATTYGQYFIEVYPYGDSADQSDTYQLRVTVESGPSSSGAAASLPAGLTLFPASAAAPAAPAPPTSPAFSAFVRPGCELLALHPAPGGRYLAAQLSCEWGSAVLLSDNGGPAQLVSGEWGQEAHFLDWRPGNAPQLVLRAAPTSGGPLLLVDAATLSATPLSLPRTTYALAFAPDGQRLLYATTAGLGHGSELWAMASLDGQATRLRSEPGHILALPRWSPDGKQWAYIRMADSTTPFTVGELWIGDAQGARMLSAVAEAGHGYAPVWSPDGQSIAFVGRENPDDAAADQCAGLLASNLYLADVPGGAVRAVTHFDGELVAEPLWDAEGNHLIVSVGAGQQADVWQIALDGSAPQRLTDGAGEMLSVWGDGTRP